MLKNHSHIRYIALITLSIMLLLTLSSCKARPLAQDKLAKTEVGKVGEYSVLYEELYFLASNYAKGIKTSSSLDGSALNDAIWESVNENITENYAILELCKKEGILYDEKALKEDVEASIAADIESEYGGSRSDYFESQLEVGLTDHYVRFITGVNLLYGELAAEYRKNGAVPSSPDVLVPYIQQNFAHTWHIAVFINDESERADKLAKIQTAKSMLDSGTSMYELIGSEYNEDVTPEYLADTYGYYFPRGVMDEVYEDASFSLSVGENIIVESTATNGKGDDVPCIYLIERLSTTSEASKTEIEKNLSTLSEFLSDAIINERKEEIKSTLKFEPNEFARSLDLANLEQAKNGADYQLIIAIISSVIAAAAVVTAAILIARAKTRRFQKSIEKYSKR